MDKVLVVDDEMGICTSLEFALEDDFEILIALNQDDAYKKIITNEVKVIILDLMLKKSNGMDFLKEIKKSHENIQVIVMTAYSAMKYTIEAIKNGAYYFLNKPINTSELKILIHKAIELYDLNNKINNLRNEVKRNYWFSLMIGKSKLMLNIVEMINQVKDIDANIFITGESGTGKELIAKAIHYSGFRAKNNFITVNCAAIPTELLESELFGYEKGSYTGAYNSKKGKFEIANNGTIFLDEIGDMNISIQAKLLRVLQEKEFSRLGSNEKIKTNFRLITATNQNIQRRIGEGKFREDLYYRINVINIKAPSLRERKEDIPLLVNFFIDKYKKHYNKQIDKIEKEVHLFLKGYNYRGNIRELENIIERLVVLCHNNEIRYGDLNFLLLNDSIDADFSESEIMTFKVGEKLEDIENKVIEIALNKFKYKRLAAEVLGISERTLYNKIKKL